MFTCTSKLTKGVNLFRSILCSALLIQAAYAQPCRYLGNPVDWIAWYRACPNSPVAAYNAIKSYQLKGDQQSAIKILNEAMAQHPNFTPLSALKQSLSEAPFSVVARLSSARLREWVQNYPQPRFTRQPPKKPEMPPTLVKDEFETTSMFKQRVEDARQARRAQIKRIKQQYADQVADYNRAVEAHNQAVQSATDKRKRELPYKRREFTTQCKYAP